MISAPYVALGLVYCWTDHTLNPTGEARAVLRRVLKDLGLSGDVISDGVLAVSELVANAHEHACGPYEVHVRSAAGRYICEIHDGDPLLPTGLYLSSTPSPGTEPTDGAGGSLVERGRGLRIVNELARGQWGFYVTERGAKAAWIVLAGLGGAAGPCDVSGRASLRQETATDALRTQHGGTPLLANMSGPSSSLVTESTGES
ncbi:ATP-binding protein [Streptomyces bacillaris]